MYAITECKRIKKQTEWQMASDCLNHEETLRGKEFHSMGICKHSLVVEKLRETKGNKNNMKEKCGLFY